MIISFFGHSDFCEKNGDREKILNILNNHVADNVVEFYLGGYGNFDRFAHECCVEFKNSHNSASIIFVTPYITEKYQNNHLRFINNSFDYIIYPPIESTPLRFSIPKRNEWIIRESDLIICHITHNFGGAFKAYRYALKKQQKKIINLPNLE